MGGRCCRPFNTISCLGVGGKEVKAAAAGISCESRHIFGLSLHTDQKIRHCLPRITCFSKISDTELIGLILLLPGIGCNIETAQLLPELLNNRTAGQYTCKRPQQTYPRCAGLARRAMAGRDMPDFMGEYASNLSFIGGKGQQTARDIYISARKRKGVDDR